MCLVKFDIKEVVKIKIMDIVNFFIKKFQKKKKKNVSYLFITDICSYQKWLTFSSI